MTDFATDPGAIVSPMTPTEMAIGLACGTLSIGQLNWLFQNAFTSGGVTKGNGAPSGAPASGDPVLYIDIQSPPDTPYYWNGTAWVSFSPAYMEPYVHAPLMAHNKPIRVNPLVTTRGVIGSTATFSAMTHCAVTLDADGAHIVTVASSACTTGSWSYIYTAQCGGESKSTLVTGRTLTGTQNTKFAMNAAAGEVANVAITTDDGSSVTIKWGGGAAPVTVASGTLTTHTYPAAFNGDVTISHSVCSDITWFSSSSGGWSGSIASLPKSLLVYENTGTNTTFGPISSLPDGLIVYANYGNNTTSGSIASLPAGLTYYANYGNNTTSGSIASLPAGLTYYDNLGHSILTAPTSVWSGSLTPMNLFRQESSVGLTVAQVDNILVALSTITSWTGNRLVLLKGTNAPPSAIGMAAAATILANGALLVSVN
jgi:hypothetical protein